MKVYVAMIADRHTDPEPEVFSTAEAAIGYARDFALAESTYGSRTGEHYEERPVEGWLFQATYTCEGDSVWVVEKELDLPEDP